MNSVLDEMRAHMLLARIRDLKDRADEMDEQELSDKVADLSAEIAKLPPRSQHG